MTSRTPPLDPPETPALTALDEAHDGAQARRSMRRLFATVAALYALLLAPIYADNENRSLNLMESVYSRATLRLDDATYPTGDLSTYDGHLYSGGAPGLAFVGLVAYAPARFVADALLGPHAGAFVAFVAAIAFAALLPALGGVWAFWRLAQGVCPAHARDAALLFACGSLLIPYGGRFMAHALVVGCLLAALLAVRRARSRGALGAPHAALAGLLVGVATTADYVAALVVLALGALLLVEPKGRWRRAGAYVAGGALPAILLGVYHNAAFGSPFALPYQFSALPATHEVLESGLLGYTWPSPSVLFQLTLGSKQGLLVYCPLVAAGLSGLVLAWRAGKARAEVLCCGCLVLTFLLLTAGRVHDFHGGQGFGPRYLLIALPFALLFLPLALERLGKGRRLFALAALVYFVTWLGGQSTTQVWGVDVSIGRQLLDVLEAGPRLCWLYVSARTFGRPPLHLVGFASASLLALWGLGTFLLWRRTDRHLAWLGAGMAVITGVQLL